MELYPFVFEPIFKDRIWGGRKLASYLSKTIPTGTTGESWELSTVAGSVSVVRDGSFSGIALTEIVQQFPQELLGGSVYRRFGATLPLLFKFIDARDDLSIQVHPDDTLARQRHDSFGKTEMWYVMQADPGARLIVGFRQTSSPGEYQRHLATGGLVDLLQQVEVQVGDTFFLAPGTIHAIGAGILLAEIQQTSDITYRVYDWGRVDAEGNSRELHVEQALEAMNYEMVEARCQYMHVPNTGNEMVSCQHFTTRFFPLNGCVTVVHDGTSFRVYVCTEGEYSLITAAGVYQFKQGDTVLVPASINRFVLSGWAVLLEVYLPIS